MALEAESGGSLFLPVQGGRLRRRLTPALAPMTKFTLSLLIFFALSLTCSAGATQMQPLFKIGVALTLARSQQPGDLCQKAIIPKRASAQIVQLLSTIDAPGLKDELGMSPAYYAVMADDPAELERLLKLGYDSSGPRDSLLDDAAFWNSVETARFLLDRGMDPNTRNGAGGTPLSVAVSEGGPDVARLLMARGAHVDARTLRYALVCRNQSVVDLLVRSGVEIDAKARDVAKKFHMKLPDNVR